MREDNMSFCVSGQKQDIISTRLGGNQAWQKYSLHSCRKKRIEAMCDERLQEVALSICVIPFASCHLCTAFQ